MAWLIRYSGSTQASISRKNTLRPPKRSVNSPSGRRTSEPVSTGVAASRPNWVSLSWSSSLIGTPSTANIIQTMKQTVKASVLMPSTRPCRTRGGVMLGLQSVRYGRRLERQTPEKLDPDQRSLDASRPMLVLPTSNEVGPKNL
ncbi:hypothetical protein D3C79_744950 [compost metagenome]